MKVSPSNFSKPHGTQRRIRVAHGAARVEAARLKDRTEGTKLRIRRKSIYQKLRTDLTYLLPSGKLT